MSGVDKGYSILRVKKILVPTRLLKITSQTCEWLVRLAEGALKRGTEMKIFNRIFFSLFK